MCPIVIGRVVALRTSETRPVAHDRYAARVEKAESGSLKRSHIAIAGSASAWVIRALSKAMREAYREEERSYIAAAATLDPMIGTTDMPGRWPPQAIRSKSVFKAAGL